MTVPPIKSFDADLQFHKIIAIKPDAKAIFPEPHNAKPAIFGQ
jgi:hypothetical protein